MSFSTPKYSMPEVAPLPEKQAVKTQSEAAGEARRSQKVRLSRQMGVRGTLLTTSANPNYANTANGLGISNVGGKTLLGT